MLNVENLATSVVGFVHPNMQVVCRKFAGMTRNAMGVVQPLWNEVTAIGQVQPQTANDVKNQLNIDVSELKMNIWLNVELHTIERQEVADQIVYDGRRWNVTTVTNWNPGNGWGNYVVTEDKYVNPDSGKVNGDGSTTGSDGLVW